MTEFRAATASDLDAIMQLERATFAPDDWSSESMLREIESEHTTYLVIVDDDRVVGYGGVLAPSGSTDADIQTIAVDPSHRRGGLGRELMTRLIARAASTGAKAVFLEVRADNPGAQQLYQSLGFVVLGVRPRYYKGGIDAVVMKLDRPGEAGAA
ncbi:ribosomal protein S18-alanine N-acetyltransferase [Paramicrobacterium agarici]|uniref:ribosomal protein S18-alanine N-acetyltransferase n=1 Tax=Paramicrobacterium agarici TaxID=630514 RepID=UPI0011729786|nr:ribosomal protein S18-alanine N-acetyltransferase [Microbacterium agarici]TQO21991.1 ribosomal-protein-alanine N-acetyltransferase [Microbacterium agarici]